MDFSHIARRNLQMSSDPIISLHNVSKTYRAYNRPIQRLILRLSSGRIGSHKKFHALDNVSLSIYKGETVGIIGRNGSGKSTLLQIICGIRKPTSGSVSVKGRISALLELGSGFQMEFTGRENVFLQGAILGISHEEMETRFDEISSFADIGEYLDQPSRTYSTGMLVRLAFAVAVAVDPDILIVDEALAVGDSRFQAKCYRRLETMKNNGTTIIIVSHAMEQITRLCDSALLLENGNIASNGDVNTVVNNYLSILFDAPSFDIARNETPHMIKDLASFACNDAEDRFYQRPAYNSNEYRWGDRTAIILDFLLQTEKENHISFINKDVKRIVLKLKIRFFRDILNPVFGLVIKSKDGYTLCNINSLAQKDEISCSRNAGEVVFIEFSLELNLLPGDYFISVGVAEKALDNIIPLDRRYDSIHFKVVGESHFLGILNMSPVISIINDYKSDTV
jgi:lipopolysaccharide transport system ATP-binding protein